MRQRIVTIRPVERTTDYRVHIANGVRFSAGRILRKVVGAAGRRAIVVSNRKVIGIYGETIVECLSKAGFEVTTELIGDGERFKNFGTFERLLKMFSAKGITRGDAIVALGGGVVGDVVGFAASAHLRGVSYVYLPTTLLSMIDSSIGGKTGINTPFGKNMAGSFYHPQAVLIDPEVLATLPKREIAAGLCEALKQGAISGTELFDKTTAMVEALSQCEIQVALQRPRFCSDLGSLLTKHIEFKADVVARDERESTEDSSPRSRKILNYGHTFAHALESATDYKFLKHGEAVGHGIIFSAVLSKKIGILSDDVVNLLCGVVRRTGSLPLISGVDPNRVFEAIKHDKKTIGKTLPWVLLAGIGEPVIVPHAVIGDKIVRETIAEFTSQRSLRISV